MKVTYDPEVDVLRILFRDVPIKSALIGRRAQEAAQLDQTESADPATEESQKDK